MSQCGIVGMGVPGGSGAEIGPRLRRERLRRHLSQEALAEQLGTTVRSVRRWESGRAVPYPHHQAAYCRVFGASVEEIFAPPADLVPASHGVFHVPHGRNPLFTGREAALAELAGVLRSAPALALCGIGGIGKTQLAIEYVHRFREHHRHVLWVSADGGGDLESSIAGVAQALALPEARASNPAEVSAGVRRWLAANRGWLLVLDNLDLPTPLGEWLPVAGAGRLLVTCRCQATGSLAQALSLRPMDREEGVGFLLRRSKLGGSAGLQGAVAEIAEIMGGLPLALDQAGAYLEETGATPAEYLELYRQRRLALLQRRGVAVVDHPDSIATTILLSYEKLRRTNPDAALVLSLCAFLHPNDIPEGLFGARDPYVLAENIASLRAYSLVERASGGGTFSVHRLVQEVLREGLPAAERRPAAEEAVALMARAFASVDGIDTWAERHRLFSHALTAARLAAEWKLATPETAELLGRTGSYLRTLGQPADALDHLDRALTIAERVHGPAHRQVAWWLNALGSLHEDMGCYDRAESLLRRALAIWEGTLAHDDLEVAHVLNDLGTLLVRQGRYGEGEAVHLRVLEILEAQPGPENPHIGVTLNNLGGHAHMAGRYADAEDYFRRALAFRRRVLGPDHPTVANVLSNLGALAYDRGRLEEAAPPLAEAERIYRLAFGEENWRLGKVLHYQALVLQQQGDLERAERLLDQALALWHRKLGEEHPRVAVGLSSLGRLRDDQGRFEEAETLHQRALSIQERTLGARHPDVATSLHNLAGHHALLGRRELALATYERSYEIRCAVLGAEHPDTAVTCRALAEVREAPGRARGEGSRVSPPPGVAAAHPGAAGGRSSPQR